MSRGGRRRRGSGGHPARVAERRARGESRRIAGAGGAATVARQIARTARNVGSALDAELWASHLLGTLWAQRYTLPFLEGADADPALLYGEPLVGELVRIDDPGAAIAIAAIAELEDGELGLHAQELLDRANLWPRLPTWVADVGESEITAGAVMRDTVFDDGRTVFLESQHADGERLAVGVLVDNNLGGIAKDVLLAESIDQVAETMEAHPADDGAELVLERIEPGVAAGLIDAALRLTDMTWDPPVSHEYWGGRALARLRADQTSGVVYPPERPELAPAEREALRDEFLASPEGAAFAGDGDEAWVAVLAIDFAADYAGGDPLRWSPVVVELFMADWVPRKVMTTDAMLDVLPGALDAWVRFAGRKRGLSRRAVALTCDAIPRYAAEMRERATDPEVGGPSKQFLLAAQKAGVDLEDPASLQSFVAGWNARGGLDLDAVDAEPPWDETDPTAGVLQVKITLTGVSKPPVWRRLQLAGDTPLDELHQIIQIAFGWQDSHLHSFEADGQSFGPLDPELDLDFADDERDVTLADLIIDAGDRVTYTYDFGDYWQHSILAEKQVEVSPGVSYPILVTAKGACPPEDCGGVWGYQHLKDVLADPAAPEHEELRRWLGLQDAGSFDPAAVDPDEIRQGLAGLQERRRGHVARRH